MLSLLRTHTEQLKWTSKREISIGKAVGKRMRGAPEPGAPAPATGHSPRILFLTAFPIDFLPFEVHFSRSVGVLRRDTTSAHVWHGLRTNLCLGVRDIFTFELGGDIFVRSHSPWKFTSWWKFTGGRENNWRAQSFSPKQKPSIYGVTREGSFAGNKWEGKWKVSLGLVAPSRRRP